VPATAHCPSTGADLQSHNLNAQQVNIFNIDKVGEGLPARVITELAENIEGFVEQNKF
jgi:hypothetical protein